MRPPQSTIRPTARASSSSASASAPRRSAIQPASDSRAEARLASMPATTSDGHFCMVVTGDRVAEKGHDAISCKVLYRTLVLEDHPAYLSMIAFEEIHDLFGLCSIGKVGEAAQINEGDGDLAPVGLEGIATFSFENGFGNLRREKAPKTAHALYFYYLDLKKVRFKDLLSRLVVHRVHSRSLSEVTREELSQALDALRRLKLVRKVPSSVPDFTTFYLPAEGRSALPEPSDPLTSATNATPRAD